MEDSLTNRMFEIAVNVPCRQLSLRSAELVCIKTGSCDPWCSKHAHARSNPSHQLFSVKTSFVPVSCLAASTMQRRLSQWKLGYASSCGIGRTGVSRRWQGRPLIGPKWEWRGRLIAIDPFLPPVGSSILDYDHFKPNQICVSAAGGNPNERY